jgi:hypothetical protein
MPEDGLESRLQAVGVCAKVSTVPTSEDGTRALEIALRLPLARLKNSAMGKIETLKI